MFLSSKPRRILAYGEPVDMRKSFNGLIAVVQALSAIAIVGIFAVVLDIAAFEIINPLTGTWHVIWVEIISYALMLGVGLWLLWGAVVGRGCSHSHHGTLVGVLFGREPNNVQGDRFHFFTLRHEQRP